MAVLALLAETVEPEKPEVRAVQAMRARGIDNPEQLLQYATTERILATCRRLDQLLGQGAKLTKPSGWLASKIRAGGLDEPDVPSNESPRTRIERVKADQRARFRERALPFPPGSVCETHATAEVRRRRNQDAETGDDLFPEDRVDEAPAVDDGLLCDGELVVVSRSGMVLEARCDSCRESLAYPLRALGALPRAPLAVGRALPPSPSAVRPRPDGGWFRGDGGLRKFDPEQALRSLEAVEA